MNHNFWSEYAPHLLLLNWLWAGFFTGLIWYVQVVHYPIFSLANTENFASFHQFHTSRTGWVVAVPMLLELGLAILLLLTPEGYVSFAFKFTSLSLVVMIWINTFFLAIPLHEKLETQGFNSDTIAQLIRINWWRTVAWTLKLILLSGVVFSKLPKGS